MRIAPVLLAPGALAARGGCQREREHERAAAAEIALDPDVSAVVIDDLAADAQSEPGPLAAVFAVVVSSDLMEPVENLVALAFGDARSAVDDLETQRTFRRCRAYDDTPGAWGVLRAFINRWRGPA
jgi:hypothetical protein